MRSTFWATDLALGKLRQIGKFLVFYSIKWVKYRDHFYSHKNVTIFDQDFLRENGQNGPNDRYSEGNNVEAEDDWGWKDNSSPAASQSSRQSSNRPGNATCPLPIESSGIGSCCGSKGLGYGLLQD